MELELKRFCEPEPNKNRVAPDLTFTYPELEPDLAETCFWVTEQYASDKTNH